jgi:hypothetical protein
MATESTRVREDAGARVCGLVGGQQKAGGKSHGRIGPPATVGQPRCGKQRRFAGQALTRRGCGGDIYVESDIHIYVCIHSYIYVYVESDLSVESLVCRAAAK